MTSFNKYIAEVDSEFHENYRFKMTRSQRTFVFENLETCADPELTLRECFEDAIERAIEKANDPDHIGWFNCF